MAKRRSRKGGKARGRRQRETDRAPASRKGSVRDAPEAEASEAEASEAPLEGRRSSGAGDDEPRDGSRPPPRKEKRARRGRLGRVKQPLRRALLALSLLSIFVLPVAQLARAAERGGASVRVGLPGPGPAIAASVPGLAALGEVLSGTVWSITLAGFELADPLAAMLVVASGRSGALLLAAIVPVLLTLFLGRFFCGWVCPARLPVELAAWLRRRGLRRIAFRAPWLKWAKYGVLVAGLGLAALTGWNLVALIYPPAILVREAQYGLAYGTLGWGAVFVGGAFLADLFVEGGVWCRGLCPGGALYSVLAQPAPLRITLDEERCTKCERCVKVCPLGLDPTTEPRGECDRCGLCQRECRDDALRYRLTLPFGRAKGGGKDGRRHAA